MALEAKQESVTTVTVTITMNGDEAKQLVQAAANSVVSAPQPTDIEICKAVVASLNAAGITG